jgi:hypothetical protein
MQSPDPVCNNLIPHPQSPILAALLAERERLMQVIQEADVARQQMIAIGRMIQILEQPPGTKHRVSIPNVPGALLHETVMRIIRDHPAGISSHDLAPLVQNARPGTKSGTVFAELYRIQLDGLIVKDADSKLWSVR